MSNAECVYGFAVNTPKRVQVCIDRLHELGDATQTVDRKVAKVSRPGDTGRQ